MKNNMQLFDIHDDKISQRFAEARKATGLNMTKFANKAGLFQSQVSEIENGTRNITAEILLKIELAFGISWRYIARNEGEIYLGTYNLAKEPDAVYYNGIEEMKKELTLWKNRFLEVNDKYTALLESSTKTAQANNNDKRKTG